MYTPHKIRNYNNYKNYITENDLANVFNVYVDNNGFANYNLNETVVFNNIEKIPINLFTLYTICPNDTLLKISYKLYNTINNWWIIAKLNGIYDAFVKLNAGDILRVFSKEQLSKFLADFGNNNVV